jgi:hypothetical protein
MRTRKVVPFPALEDGPAPIPSLSRPQTRSPRESRCFVPFAAVSGKQEGVLVHITPRFRANKPLSDGCINRGAFVTCVLSMRCYAHCMVYCITHRGKTVESIAS